MLHDRRWPRSCICLGELRRLRTPLVIISRGAICYVTSLNRIGNRPVLILVEIQDESEIYIFYEFDKESLCSEMVLMSLPALLSQLTSSVLDSAGWCTAVQS